jgi:hypothetical protein
MGKTLSLSMTSRSCNYGRDGAQRNARTSHALEARCLLKLICPDEPAGWETNVELGDVIAGVTAGDDISELIPCALESDVMLSISA